MRRRNSVLAAFDFSDNLRFTPAPNHELPSICASVPDIIVLSVLVHHRARSRKAGDARKALVCREEAGALFQREDGGGVVAEVRGFAAHLLGGALAGEQ